MAQEFDFKLIDNSAIVKAAAKAQIEAALEAVGIQAEGDAKLLCPVDTGLLRNSITHAVGGSSPAISSYSGKDVHGTNPNTTKNGTAGKPASGPHSGNYSGTMGKKGDNTVYVGTNVEYAETVEMGSSSQTAQPFLKPAINAGMGKYKEIVKKHLQN